MTQEQGCAPTHCSWIQSDNHQERHPSYGGKGPLLPKCLKTYHMTKNVCKMVISMPVSATKRYSHITVNLNESGRAARIPVPIPTHEKEFTKFKHDYEVKVGDKKVTAAEKKYIIWMVLTGKASIVRSRFDEDDKPWNAVVTKGASNTWIYRNQTVMHPLPWWHGLRRVQMAAPLVPTVGPLEGPLEGRIITP